MATNYDGIAHYYDLISRIVFGKTLVNAQTCLLKHLPANSNILLVGGGTGWILEEISSTFPSGLNIDFVESSAQMILLSKKRNFKQNKVNFINLPIENFNSEQQYDVIFTPFLFDNFSKEKIQIVFSKLDSFLKNNGSWLQVDFVIDKNKFTHHKKIFLKVMYLFFHITCSIETQILIDMEIFFEKNYYKIYEKSHIGNFIKSIAYIKS